METIGADSSRAPSAAAGTRSSAKVPLFRLTRALKQKTRYGGWNRSEQIREVIEREGRFALREVDFFARGYDGRFGNLAAGCRLLSSLPKEFSRSYRRTWVLGRLFRLIAALRKEAGGQPPILIWENTEDTLLAPAAKAAGARLVAFPHNINAFYNPQDGATRAAILRDLDEEVASLSLAEAVITICAEEQNLLAKLGVRSELLSYYPPSDYLAELSEQRRQRKQNPELILILGSAHNRATAEGIRAQLQAATHWPERARRRLVVAGASTEVFAEEFAPHGIAVRGRVSEEELRHLVADTRALWVHQYSGTGAVTRIADLLCSGVSIVANRIAARGWMGTTGVHVYETFDQITEILGQLREPPIPRFPLEQVDAVGELLRNVAGKTPRT